MRTFVAVDGRRIALYRGTPADPAPADPAPAGIAPVVAIPGAGLVGLDFGSVADVTYDRGGTGWSDPVPLPRSAAAVAAELRAALIAAEVPGPWVLLGHSMGALYARRFAQLFPADVRGLLLLDPGHEDLFDYLPPEAAGLNAALKPDPDALPDLTAEQTAAAREAFGRLYAACPPPVRDELIDHHLTHWRTSLREAANLETEVYPEVRAGGPVPDVPITVLTAGAGNPAWGSVADPDLVRRALAGIRRLHAEIAASVSCGEHRVVAGASHQYLHLEHPGVVRAAGRALAGQSFP